MGPIVALLVIAAVSLIVIRVGALALIRTGLSKDAASFQALSAFFGVGFTTSEAELVVNHPVRRRIITHLIVVGNLGVLSALGLVFVGFFPTGDSDNIRGVPEWLFKLVFIIAGLGAIWLLSRLNMVKRILDWMISLTLARSGVIRVLDYEMLLRIASGFSVSEIEIDPGNELVGKLLVETRLRQQGVLVLGIARDDGSYVGAPRGPTQILSGDVLTVYGRDADIRAAFHIPAPATLQPPDGTTPSS